MIDDEEQRPRFLERLAEAGISEESWAYVRRMRHPDLSALDSPVAREREQALDEVVAQEQFIALAKVKAMLADDAPVVARGHRPAVFEVGMFALTVLQDMYRIGHRSLDFGPVRVTRAARLGEVADRAEAALQELTLEHRTELITRAEESLVERVRPSEEDRAPVLAYRILQLAAKIVYQTQDCDPGTYLTPLQEEIFASQVASERRRPCLRIGTAMPVRTLGWVSREQDGRWLVDMSDHPFARRALDEINWLRERSPESLPEDDPPRYLEALADFLRKRDFTADVLA